MAQILDPIVGVMPLWDEERQSLWMLPGYVDGIREAGGLPLVLPLTVDHTDINRFMELCDGFLFTGGQDVSPGLYGEEPLPGKSVTCPERDRMEKKLLERAVLWDKPVLGICRGIQFINAALGGTLYQDLGLQYSSPVEHHMAPPYDRVAHQVDILRGTPLYKLLRVKRLGVNSYHHQAVKDVAQSLKVMAVSEDGLVEAVYMPGHRFLWGVQWHPEFSFRTDESSRRIFEAFVESMRT